MGDVQDILLVGFGAVGVIYALVLERSKRARVTAIARGNFDSIQANGIHIHSKKYGEVHGWKPYRLLRSVQEATDRKYAYVVLSTKALPDVTPTSATLSPLLSKEYPFSQPTYVLFQNGLGVENDLYESALKLGTGEPRILSAAVYIGTNLIGERDTVEHGDWDRLLLGWYRSPSPVLSATPSATGDLASFAELIHDGGGTVEVVEDIGLAKYTKNIWNAAFATSSTLVRHPLPAFFAPPAVESVVIPVIRALIEEVIAVGRALGYDENVLPSSLADETIERSAKLHKGVPSTHRPSMLVDLDTGRPLELEVILGEVVKSGKKYGVHIPRLETIYGLLSVVQGQLNSHH